MTTTTPSDAGAHLAHCPCGAEVRNDGFRDRASYTEFRITGLCQACQDRIFLATCAADPAKRFALRHGVVVAHDAARDELAALPFLYTAEPRVAWDAHRIVRIGARLQRLDPHRALAPMAETLTGHAVFEVVVDIVSPEREARFQELMQAHHYLGALPKIGQG